MDIASLASAIMVAHVGRAQLAVAAKLARMDADQARAVASLLEAAEANFDRLANVASGLGTQLDITV
ncbi:MAG TPA: hypothetical protein VNL39_05605 [Xanthobacteraceae bacterium]|nr:hypothetical protein [Xanthobacteraceae bacterium]